MTEPCRTLAVHVVFFNLEGASCNCIELRARGKAPPTCSVSNLGQLLHEVDDFVMAHQSIITQVSRDTNSYQPAPAPPPDRGQCVCVHVTTCVCVCVWTGFGVGRMGGGVGVGVKVE